ncbi:MAG: TonB-dependent receptor [Ignavibacteriaceae bacterium]|nr:TonB-dependent receptor [Ignavibacteriaceae bacterium]
MQQKFSSFKHVSSTLFLFFFFACALVPQEKVYNLNEIVVTAGRTTSKLSETTRNIQIIKPEDIAAAPVNSVQDLLQYVTGVDIKQRGVEGVQADVSIRGGTFEQTLIMIDGIKVSDPQTAHHNLNLPLSLDQIERIEIVKGDGSSSFGPNAFGGVINIITKKENGKSAAVQITGGEHGFYDAELSGSFGFSSMNNHFSFSKIKSDGYRHNTNFDEVNASYRSSILFDGQFVNFSFGYDDKEFGANSFYSDKYPDQWEHTRTKLASAVGEFNVAKLVVTPKFFWRRNDDEYFLNYLNPSFYRNVHQTNVYGAEVQAAFKTEIGTTAFGVEYKRDVIASSNLGDHSREQKGIFAEQKIGYKIFNAAMGFFAYNYANIGWKFWPGVSFGYNLFPAARIYASYGKAFRLPSFTELYYNYFVTPKNGTQKGNSNLQYEESSNYEVGMHFVEEKFSASFSLFKRNGNNSIDWGKAATDSVWHSYNIVNVITSGFEGNTELNTADISLQMIKKITIGYTYLNVVASLNRENFQSRYVLDHLRHQLVVGISNELFFNIIQTWMLRYENRITGDKNFLVDIQMKKSFANFNVFLKATNLFNKSYKDFTGVFLPGRWLFAGIKASVQY